MLTHREEDKLLNEIPNHVEIISKEKSVEFVDGWYDEASNEHFWMRWRLSAFLRLLRDQKVSMQAPLRALDIGGGAGVFSRQVEAHTQWTVDCADLNQRALGVMAPGRGRALYYNIQKPKPEMIEAYDVVFLFDVIEHIEATPDFIASALKHLKPGGLLFINVPAFQTLYSRYDLVVGHIRRYNQRTLAAELKDQSVKLVEQRYWGGTLIPIAVARKLFLATKAAKNLDTVKVGFQPPLKIINTLLTFLGKVETFLLSRPLAGTSLMLTAIKK